MTQQYPYPPQPGPAPTPKPKSKKLWIALAIVAAPFTLIGVYDVFGPSPEPAVRYVQQAPPPATAPSNAPIVTTGQDPLVTDGTWLVGSEIQPGVYRADAAVGASLSYWKRCADAACKIGEGRIQSGFPGLIEIAPTDYAVSLDGLVLTRME